MSNEDTKKIKEIENKEWLESLDYILQTQGPKRVTELLRKLTDICAGTRS